MLYSRLLKVPYIILFFAAVFSIRSFAQDTIRQDNEFIPDLDVILKTKVEFDLDNSKMRFEVRNARFGVKGKINPYMAYRVELDLSDEGRMKMLDAYVEFIPFSNFNLYLGQRKIPFSSDYMRNPADNIFANRSFVAKYINDGLRDIGFYADYKFTALIPVNIILGAVNGTGNNNPQWIDRPNLVTRLILGSDQGFRVIGNLYYGSAESRNHLAMFGEEIRYSSGSFFIESEYVRSNWTDSLSIRRHDDGLYLHSYYNFLTNSKMIYMITPVARYDFMGEAILSGKTDASRITVGLNIGFAPKQFYSEIRFNYENYLKSSLPIHTDKVTIEFIGRF